MIAAIYARKSTDQAGVADDEKSVARQIDHAQAYAEHRGWRVWPEHIYSDDGISGAEFVKRPGFARLMSALKPGPPFDVLIMSEESRLGRDQIETAYALKQIIDAGVRVFVYLDDREISLSDATQTAMLQLRSFGAAVEREQASKRTHDAMLAKAKALHVTGGRVYGYANVDVFGEPDADRRRKRLYVVRKINEEQATTVRKIFQLSASGLGLTRIAKTLNAEHVPPPRQDARGWAPTAIREILYRDLYRGVVVWNRSQKIVRAGTKKQRKRPKDDWVTIPAPELQIVSGDLWRAVHTRLETAKPWFARMRRGETVTGRPSHTDSAYLLTGFATCAVCRGPLATISRMHGTAPHRRLTRFYGCTIHEKRGRAICANPVVLRQEIVDQAILSAITDALDGQVVDHALDKALKRLHAQAQQLTQQRTRLVRELNLVEGRISRLLDVLADGRAPKDEIIGRLNAEKARKTELTTELERALRRPMEYPLPAVRLKEMFLARLAHMKGLLGRHTPHTRQMLRKLLADKIQMEPMLNDRQRGYHFRGALTIGGLLEGEARELVPSWWPQRDSNPCFSLERAIA